MSLKNTKIKIFLSIFLLIFLWGHYGYSITEWSEESLPVLREELRELSLVTGGGTGKFSWTQYTIPYLDTTATFGEVAIGTAGQALVVNSTVTGYEWSTAAGTGDISEVGDATTGDVFTEDGLGNELYFEGSTANNHEILLTADDPATDHIITLSDFTGYAVLNVNECTDIEGTGLSVTTGTLNASLTLQQVCSAGYSTTSAIIVDDITVSTPVNVYSLSHDSFTDFVANEHIDWTNTASNFLTTGTLGCNAFTMTQNSDTIALTHNGSSGYLTYSGTNLYLQSTAGATGLLVHGASGADAKLMVYHGDGGGRYFQFLTTASGVDFSFGSAIVDAVFNEDGVAVDFKFETDNEEYAFYLDSNAAVGVDRVHVLDSTGTADFNVGGDTWMSGDLEVDGNDIDFGDAGGFTGFKFVPATTTIDVYIDSIKIGHYSTDGSYTDDVP